MHIQCTLSGHAFAGLSIGTPQGSEILVRTSNQSHINI